MVPFVTLAALAAINPLVQAGPVRRSLVARQQNCAAALILAQGISENIEDQKNEQTALAQVADVLNKTPVDASAFATAKANLLTFVNNGIAIRQANQLITPLGNKATAGLATVADAQLDELNLTLGLTGDPAKDADAINKLNDGFTNGLKQNEQNLADAMAGCVNNNGVLFANGTDSAGPGSNNGTADAKEADRQQKEADRQQKEADRQQQEAERKQEEADRKEADRQQKEADRQQKEADRQQKEANRQQKEAANNDAGKESDKNAPDANAAQNDACN